jgi:4-diphosphocytidyl-2-C-methyl-D-erythritol kinase
MISFPNCKINLGLSVTEKRNDGFHNIETVFYPVMLTDMLELLKTDKNDTEIELLGYAIDGKKEDNLCLKAYNLLKKNYDIGPVEILLSKKIPHGAGLGGGSADAAFTLKMLNDFFQLNISVEELIILTAELGSDCSFFIKNRPVFAYGKGEKFKSICVDLNGYEIVIIKPKISVNTAEAYKWIKPLKREIAISEVIEKFDITQWKHLLINDFEKPVFLKYPELEQIKQKLYEFGAIYSAMSGSGSAIFGIAKQFEKIHKSDFNDCFFWKGVL